MIHNSTCFQYDITSYLDNGWINFSPDSLFECDQSYFMNAVLLLLRPEPTATV